VLLAGHLPFEDDNIASLYKKVYTDGTTPRAMQKNNTSNTSILDISNLLFVDRSQELSLHVLLGFLLEPRGWSPEFWILILQL